ncbi:hypothetical protein [Paenibacillus methanolicus]|uniref:Uncharacterized protein n=1 Tax=Paenibacillus methanolicus TaxID=582686 RepID=A0A5S5BYR4_9BACL|nr:hypothetical protein [Paenibacillus methanolicus]TYP70813.1 hypothetical protein BCM02_111321 [Paenibacillus methanolicus]
MKSTRMIMAASLAAAITLSSGLLSDRGYAAVLTPTPFKTKQSGQPSALLQTQQAEQRFLQALGASSSDDVREALYNGSSLAAIASRGGSNAQQVVDLQLSELAEQLRQRYASGNISLAQYEAHLAELPEIVADSVFANYA